jgi:hypothetical protein
MGGCFIIIGVVFYIWGKYEEEKYFNTIVHRFDVREYLEHLPFRPEPGALRTGGIIALILGTIMLIGAGIIWLLNITISG